VVEEEQVVDCASDIRVRGPDHVRHPVGLAEHPRDDRPANDDGEGARGDQEPERPEHAALLDHEQAEEPEHEDRQRDERERGVDRNEPDCAQCDAERPPPPAQNRAAGGQQGKRSDQREACHERDERTPPQHVERETDEPGRDSTRGGESNGVPSDQGGEGHRADRQLGSHEQQDRNIDERGDRGSGERPDQRESSVECDGVAPDRRLGDHRVEVGEVARDARVPQTAVCDQTDHVRVPRDVPVLVDTGQVSGCLDPRVGADDGAEGEAGDDDQQVAATKQAVGGGLRIVLAASEDVR